ncbi:uncharacterized protein LOC111698059 isoform X2 [Eurytemora carolleeae]|uniref:uncharacterized protein LOC111698059 isoform X2 n=1 Tax=Eurytemora carolleeae TaxID=1294199 RepID=UPI000C7665E1|nr:uncharacterized protein LOC111698059 isoform X2 [Eurytemora carolleeae]|eukprot:XP_023324060.1 uncharacterized protein LOC111698059 isoform X2 [Eurytemora affinis]
MKPNVLRLSKVLFMVLFICLIIYSIQELEYLETFKIIQPAEAEYPNSFCNCKPRIARYIENINEAILPEYIDFSKVKKGDYVGKSTCNNYTSALGAGQNVLSYSLYNPPRALTGEILELDAWDTKYIELIEDIIPHAEMYYPGWRIRIYHNITRLEPDRMTRQELCRLYCTYHLIDLCDVTNLPSVGNLNERSPVGRLWRFQPAGDPTVDAFACRDIDSYMLDREVFAVKDWLKSPHQYHIMRDGPFHTMFGMLAGMWGGRNYQNMTLALEVRKAYMRVQPSEAKSSDQDVLISEVYPLLRDFSLIHDSHGCVSGLVGANMAPYPTRRVGFTFVGYGPSWNHMMWALANSPCPVECRPPNHQDWDYC